jgi:phage gpG-like protein
MPVQIKIDTREWDKLGSRVSDIAKRPEHYRMFTLMTKILAKSWWGQTFMVQGARRGHRKWQPLSPAYARWKAKAKGHSRVLLFYGHLMGSVQVLASGKDFLDWGTEIPYAHYHQEGVPGRLPKREFLFVTRKDIDEMEQFITRFINRALGRY